MANARPVKSVPVLSGREPTPTDHLIGQLIRQRRLELRIRQDELARLIKVTPRQLQKYEQGENRISVSRLMMCTKPLGVPVTWFFERLPPALNATAGRTELPGSEGDLMDLYRQLPHDVREKLIAIAKVLLPKA
jgi:transcriptional regulator with XRE-family HTH domain